MRQGMVSEKFSIYIIAYLGFNEHGIFLADTMKI
jgi:hypothetical protein